MPTYDEMRVRQDVQVVYWLEISGIPWAFSDGHITEANKAALFTDAYTSIHTFTIALSPLSFSHSKSLEVLSGSAQTGGLEIKLVDQEDWTATDRNDGLLTWLFGSERTSILRTRLTADVQLHAGGAGHNWTVADSSAFPASGVIYCGLETCTYASKSDATHFTTVVRSYHVSESQAHRAVDYGTSTIYPDVTDHPLEWQGRIVTLFQTFMDADGTLASTDDTAATTRAAAHKIRGVLRDISYEDNTWSLQCDGIDTLLDRQICRGLARSRISNRVMVTDAIYHSDDITANTAGIVMAVYQRDNAGGSRGAFAVCLAAGDRNRWISDDEFIRALNGALHIPPVDFYEFNVWRGQLTATLEATQLKFDYVVDGANPRVCIVDLRFRIIEDDELGCSDRYWNPLGIYTEQGAAYEVTGGDDIGGAHYQIAIDRVQSCVLGEGEYHKTVLLAQRTGDSPIADFVPFAGQDYVAITSSAGTEIAKVRYIAGLQCIDTANNTMMLDRNYNLNTIRLRHEQTADQPVIIQRIYRYAAGQAGLLQSSMQLLLSTGAAQYSAGAIVNYNATTYDVLPEGVGAAFPCESMAAGAASGNELVDVAAFERFFGGDALMACNGVDDAILEPEGLKDWLSARLAFLGGYLCVIDGQISVRKGVSALENEGRDIYPTVIVDKGSRSITRPQKSTIGGVRFLFDWQLTDEEFLTTLTYLCGNAKSTNKDNIVELEGKGLRIDIDRIGMLGLEMLADYGLENPIYAMTLDRSQLDLEPGQAIRYYDEGYTNYMHAAGLPRLAGARGHAGTRMMILEAAADHAQGKLALKAIQVRRKRGGYSPSAWVESYQVDTPIAGVTRLHCTTQLFSNAADGIDVSRFRVGEKVRVIEITPTSIEVGESTGHTILTITPALDHIDVTPNVDATKVVSGTPLCCIHDEFALQAAGGEARNWCAVGHVSGDIGGTGIFDYVW